MRRERGTVKLFLFLLVIIVLMAVLWIVMRRVDGAFEAEMPMVETEDIYTALEEEKPQPQGKVEINGKKTAYYDEIVTYLVIGTDASGNDATDMEEYQGSMADFLMLVVLNKTKGTYGTLQLNRDTMTRVALLQKDGSANAHATIQLCTAHWYGKDREAGCENTVSAVSELLGGINIDGYYALDMKGITELNRLAGGVEVTLLEDFTDVDKAMKKGKTVTLTEEQAYHYVHDRYGVGDETNLSRMKRQKQYIEKLSQTLKSRLVEDTSFINQMYRQLTTYATTNITARQFSVLAQNAGMYESMGSVELEGKMKVGEALGDGIEHAEFYLDDGEIDRVLKILYLDEKEE